MPDDSRVMTGNERREREMGNDMQQRSPSGLESDKLQLMVKKKKKNKEMETELMFSHVKSRI